MTALRAGRSVSPATAPGSSFSAPHRGGITICRHPGQKGMLILFPPPLPQLADATRAGICPAVTVMTRQAGFPPSPARTPPGGTKRIRRPRARATGAPVPGSS